MGYETASGPTADQPNHAAVPEAPTEQRSILSQHPDGAAKFSLPSTERGTETAGTETDGRSADAEKTSVDAETTSEPAEQLPFPYELRPVDEATQRRVIADFGALPGGIQSLLDWEFKIAGTATAADLVAHYNQPLRRGDVWVCSPPKCGSMWTQELVWLLENDLDFDGCRVMLTERWRFSESRFVADLEERARLRAEREARARAPAGAAPPAPSRFVKSHFPMSLQPPRLLDTCKVVYLARNPKDICVSFFNHSRRYKTVNFDGDFDAFAEHFLAGSVVMTPVVPHMLEAWRHRHHPNLCFIFYEDMKRDLRGQIRRLAAFLGRSYSDADVDRLAEYLHIDNFKKNPWRSEDFGKQAGVVIEGTGEFIRTGKTGNWKNYMSAELSERFDRLIERQLRGSDLSFVMELEEQD